MKALFTLLLLTFTCTAQDVNKFYIPSNYAGVTAAYMPSYITLVWYSGVDATLKDYSDYFRYYDSLYGDWMFMLVPVSRDSIGAIHTFTITSK